MRASIAAGAGFIGSHLSEALLADGDAITTTDHLPSSSRGNVEHLTDHLRFGCVTDTITNEAGWTG